MRKSLSVIALVLSPAVAKAQPDNMLTGTFSNEEQVYFDKQANRPPPKKLVLKVTASGETLTIQQTDDFGTASPNVQTAKIRRDGNLTTLDFGSCQRTFRTTDAGLIASEARGRCNGIWAVTAITSSGMTVDTEGTTTELRRSRPVSCWVAILKDKAKADGSGDWFFQRDVALHDQGGRARIGGGDSGAPQLVIRIRNVTWDTGSTNKPAVTLYIHKPETPDRAEAYAWAAPDSSRVGINLRWMQTGCSIGG
jgi:hypothetical protein